MQNLYENLFGFVSVAEQMKLGTLKIRKRETSYGGNNVYYAGLSSSSITYVVKASDRSKFILSHTYYNLDGSDRVYQTVIANNGLTFGNSNNGGTQVIEGTTENVVFYIMYLV